MTNDGERSWVWRRDSLVLRVLHDKAGVHRHFFSLSDREAVGEGGHSKVVPSAGVFCFARVFPAVPKGLFLPLTHYTMTGYFGRVLFVMETKIKLPYIWYQLEMSDIVLFSS